MFCKQCGNQLEADAKFCPKCGTPVESSVPVSQTDSSQNSPAEVAAPAEPSTTAPAQIESIPSPSSLQGEAVAGTQVIGGMPGFAAIFKAAWRNYTSKFGKLMLMQLLFVLPLIVLILLGVLVFAATGESGFNNPVVLVMLVVLGLAAFVGLIYWSLLIQAAMVQMLLSDTYDGIKANLSIAKSKIRNYFFASLISGALILLGTIAFIIPGIILAVMFVFAPYIAIVENKGAIESVKLSRAYVRDHFWAVFGRFVLFGLIYIGISIVIGILDTILSAAMGSEGMQVFGNILSFVISPLVTAFILAMYLSLKQANGEVAVDDKGGRWYIVLAVIGALLIPIMLLSSVVLLALNSARGKSRDAKRAADVRQIYSAIELYYNDNGRFPANISDLAPGYLDSIPQSPTPPDGSCTEIDNRYSYAYISATDFALSFCLGAETNGIAAGKSKITAGGIQSETIVD